MEDHRPHPPLSGSERDLITGFLDFQRATLEWKCSGLDHDQLSRRAVEPSSLSLLGLVRHMTEVERGWFRRCLDGQEAPDVYCTPERPDADFADVAGADVEETFARWHGEVAESRRIVASFDSLDDLERDQSQDEVVTLRWVLLHMIEEYARHNGHADFLRERIDGATGE